MEKALLQRNAVDENKYKIELESLKLVLEEKLKLIEELRVRGNGDWCVDHDSDDELTQGTCTKSKLKRRVFKKIEDLNEFIRSEVKPEISKRYETEIKTLLQKHEGEKDQMKKLFNVELQQKLHSLKMLVIEVSAAKDKFKEQNLILENTIAGKNKTIEQQKGLLEKQAARLDEIKGELKVVQERHDGCLNRLKLQHETDLHERHRSLAEEIESLQSANEIQLKTIEELKKIHWP